MRGRHLAIQMQGYAVERLGTPRIPLFLEGLSEVHIAAGVAGRLLDRVPPDAPLAPIDLVSQRRRDHQRGHNRSQREVHAVLEKARSRIGITLEVGDRMMKNQPPRKPGAGRRAAHHNVPATNRPDGKRRKDNLRHAPGKRPSIVKGKRQRIARGQAAVTADRTTSVTRPDAIALLSPGNTEARVVVPAVGHAP